MDYTKILTRSFEVVRRNRALWLFGILLALFGGGGGGGGGFPGGGTGGSGRTGPTGGLPFNFPNIDFNALVPHETFSVGYAVCYLRSEAEQRGLQLLVGSSDEAKVYLNGKQVYKHSFPRVFVPEQDRVSDIALNVGLNVLVFKFVNERVIEWKGSLRITDALGNPVQGIQVTLDPEGK